MGRRSRSRSGSRSRSRSASLGRHEEYQTYDDSSRQQPRDWDRYDAGRSAGYAYNDESAAPARYQFDDGIGRYGEDDVNDSSRGGGREREKDRGGRGRDRERDRDWLDNRVRGGGGGGDWRGEVDQASKSKSRSRSRGRDRDRDRNRKGKERDRGKDKEKERRSRRGEDRSERKRRKERKSDRRRSRWSRSRSRDGRERKKSRWSKSRSRSASGDANRKYDDEDGGRSRKYGDGDLGDTYGSSATAGGPKGAEGEDKPKAPRAKSGIFQYIFNDKKLKAKAEAAGIILEAPTIPAAGAAMTTPGADHTWAADAFAPDGGYGGGEGQQQQHYPPQQHQQYYQQQQQHSDHYGYPEQQYAGHQQYDQQYDYQQQQQQQQQQQYYQQPHHQQQQRMQPNTAALSNILLGHKRSGDRFERAQREAAGAKLSNILRIAGDQGVVPSGTLLRDTFSKGNVPDKMQDRALPYHCNKCTNKFPLATVLSEHLKTAHGIIKHPSLIVAAS